MRYRNSRNAEALARFWGKPLERADWYSLKAEAGEDEAELLIYDVIGWPFIPAAELVQQLAGLKVKALTVRINSPGGDVFDGMAIYNAMRDHPARVTTRVEGMAASIASVIAMAGDQVTAHKNAMMMIHEPWALVAGDQHLLRDTAEVLGKIRDNILQVYYDKTEDGRQQLKDEMQKETWFTAAEAKSRGLIDEVLDQPAVKAAFDLGMFAHVPDGMRAEGRDLTPREVEHALLAYGASQRCAKRWVSENRPRRDDADDDQRDAGVQAAVNGLIQSITR